MLGGTTRRLTQTGLFHPAERPCPPANRMEPAGSSGLRLRSWAAPEVRTSLLRVEEALELRQALLFADALAPEERRLVRDGVQEHITHAVSVEWPAMKAGDHGPRSAGNGLGKVLTALLADDHAGGNRRAAEEHTVRALERALDAQRQRLFISQTSVSGIKWFVFMVLAGLIELTIAMIHVENRSTKVITMLIFATAVAVSTLLIMAYDRPFGGGVSVTPAALTDVLPR